MPPLEPELDELLCRLVPRFAQEREGASPSEVDEIRRLAGGALPPFYEWFLATMGRNMAGFRYPTLDFSAGRIIEAYRSGEVEPSARYFTIAVDADEQMPSDVYYDLSRPARGDAQVKESYETLREMLAWRAMLWYRIARMPVKAKGRIESSRGPVLAAMGPLLASEGLESLVPSGDFSAVFDDGRLALACMAPVDPDARRYTFFSLGAEHEPRMRSILGTIAQAADLEVSLEG